MNSLWCTILRTDDLEKTAKELTARAREQVKEKNFAIPSKAPESGSYPVPDLAHARNALARVAQHGNSEEKAKVRAKIRAKFPALAERSETLGKKADLPPVAPGSLARHVALSPAIGASAAAHGLLSAVPGAAALRRTYPLDQKLMTVLSALGGPAGLVAPGVHEAGRALGGAATARQYAKLRIAGHGTAGTPAFRFLRNLAETGGTKEAVARELVKREETIKKALAEVNARRKFPLLDIGLSKDEKLTKALLAESLRHPGTGGKGSGVAASLASWKRVAGDAAKSQSARRMKKALGVMGVLAAALAAKKALGAGKEGE